MFGGFGACADGSEGPRAARRGRAGYVVGVGEVVQQSPLAVTVAPPSEVTLPPLIAVVWVILLAEVVVKVGMITLSVVSCNSLP